MDSSDEALIEASRAGSALAFEQLMRRYERLVFKVAYGYTRSRDNALDVTQNVFLSVHRKLGGFEGRGSFKGWLLRITANESLNWIRDQMRHQDHEELVDEAHAEARPGPQHELESRERRDHLRRSLFCLNPRHRLAVVLRYFEGLPVKEIAGLLDCSEGVVKNILFRSLRRMRDQLTLAADGQS